ncbi:MAG: hypothetical protein HYU66_28735 [Armatimonadetes bacterium]|nr:hypothetical protein [Armatimonadota bacterium]
MQVTGYQLRRALKRLERRRTLLQNQWRDCLHAFADEQKSAPATVLDQLRECEAQIALLQTVQARYNLGVTVEVRHGGAVEAVPLLEAIKRLGGVARLEMTLKSATQQNENAYLYGMQQLTRNVSEERAASQLAPDQAAELTDQLGDLADALREAIAVGNQAAYEVDDLDPALLA